MINADNRLITELMPNKLGVDAFALLMAITSHLGKDGTKTAWPGVDRLRDICKVEIKGELRKMPRARAYAGLKRLEDNKIIERNQENKNGEWGKIVYKVTTQYLGVFMGVQNFELTDNRVSESRNTESRNTEMRNTENVHTEYIDHVQGINHVQGIDKIERGKRDRFTPPALEELTTYMQDRGLGQSIAQREAETMHDHFESNGWKVGGKTKMKDWKAAARNWIRRRPEFNRTNQLTLTAQPTPAPAKVFQIDPGARAAALDKLDKLGWK